MDVLGGGVSGCVSPRWACLRGSLSKMHKLEGACLMGRVWVCVPRWACLRRNLSNMGVLEGRG